MQIMDLLLIKFLICFSFHQICIAVDVTLTSDGPACLDTPITFQAKLDSANGVYYYKWKDDTYRTYKIDKQGPTSNWTIIYNSQDDNDFIGLRKVTVTVYEYIKSIFIPIPIGEKIIDFRLTEYLNGNLTVTQKNVTSSSPLFVSTLNATNITTTLHDPSGWIHRHTQRVTFYVQIINQETQKYIMLGPCLTPSMIYNISKPGNYIIQCNVVLLLSDKPVTTTTTTTTTSTSTTTPPPNNKTTTKATTTSTTSPPSLNKVSENHAPFDPFNGLAMEGFPIHNRSLSYDRKSHVTFPSSTYKCDGWWRQAYEMPSIMPPEMFTSVTDKYGNFINYVKAREPLRNFNVTGNKWLKHGEILNLNITCTGSGPFNYCFNITYGAFNESDKMHCDNHNFKSNECSFRIHHYLRHNGTYTVVVSVYNEVSKILERTAINVYMVDRKPQLSYIIVPISCSLVAIIIIIFGIAHFIQSTNRYSIEVADFDFGASEDAEYKTLFQQVKESFYKAFASEIDNSDSGWRPPRAHIERPRILEDEISNEEG